jgi:hypothetical protein
MIRLGRKVFLQFEILVNTVSLIKTCLNKTYTNMTQYQTTKSRYNYM